MENDFLLSVEELALAMSLVGRPESGHNLMAAQLGAMKQEEARIRLLTAGHSLMARGWLAMDAQGTMHLADSVARVARVLSRADFSIRYGRAHQNAEFSLAFHFGEGGIFAHRIEQGVVHHIAEVYDRDTVIQGGMDFLEVSQAHPFTCPSVTLPYNLLAEVKDERDVSSILQRLRAATVPQETGVLLAEDLYNARYRGSVLRVEYDENNVPRSDRGLLILRGPERLWLLLPIPGKGEPSVTVQPGTEESFRQQVVALL